MDARLVQLLTSFTGARDRYALARLELALHDEGRPALPPNGRFAEPSEKALREEWPAIELQLDDALALLKRRERDRRRAREAEEFYRRVSGALRELDQYARAIRWVLTVTQSPRYDL